MPDFTIAGLGARISTTIDNWNAFLDQNRNWLAGTADGGPDGDGLYPLTNGVGLTVMVPCPAALADSVSGPVAAVEAAKIAAETASSIAATHAATSEEQADLAQAAKTAVEALVATAAGHAATAEGHADDAAASLASTLTLTSDLAASVALNAANTTNLAAAVADQTALSALVTDARDDATAAASTATTQAGLASAAKIAAEAARDEAESIVTGDLSGAVIISKLGFTPANKAGENFTGAVNFASAPTIAGSPLLSSAAPSGLASSAAAGSGAAASREDHVHQFPLATVSQTMTSAGSLASTDHGKVVEWNAASGALTLPNSLPAGFNCLVRVIHASGIPTFTAGSGATIRQADSLTKARKQWSEVSVSVRANSGGSAAEYVISGDMS